MLKTQKRSDKPSAEVKKLKYSDVKGWIWDYFDGTIKVFVPKQLKLSFQQYVKTNKLKVTPAATYTISSLSEAKTNSGKYLWRTGRDYISQNKNKDLFTVWLKTAIKEL